MSGSQRSPRSRRVRARIGILIVLSVAAWWLQPSPLGWVDARPNVDELQGTWQFVDVEYETEGSLVPPDRITMRVSGRWVLVSVCNDMTAKFWTLAGVMRVRDAVWTEGGCDLPNELDLFAALASVGHVGIVGGQVVLWGGDEVFVLRR